MAAIESPESVGVRPFHEFAEANDTWPRGERLEAIRSAAGEFRARFKAQGEVKAIRTIDLVAAAYPTRYAFGGAARGGLNPYLNILNRMVVVQFEDFEGELTHALLGADRSRGVERGAVLRPADRALPALGHRERGVEGVQHRHLGARGLRPDTGRRRFRLVRPPARAGHADPDGDHAAGRGRARGRASPCSRTPASSASARRSTRSARPTRCSGPGTSREGWTT